MMALAWQETNIKMKRKEKTQKYEAKRNSNERCSALAMEKPCSKSHVVFAAMLLVCSQSQLTTANDVDDSMILMMTTTTN